MKVPEELTKDENHSPLESTIIIFFFSDDVDFSEYEAAELEGWLRAEASTSTKGFKLCPSDSRLPKVDTDRAFKV